MRNQKGITLVALVITMIVLLILAGVSIAMLNNILIQPKEPQTTTREEDNEKIVKSAVSDLLTAYYEETNNATNTENTANTSSTLEINAEELEDAIHKTSSNPGINSVTEETLDIAEDEVDTAVPVIKVDFVEGEDIYVIPTTGKIVTAKSAE